MKPRRDVRPILFSSPMVRAMFCGRKTMTRRMAVNTRKPTAVCRHGIAICQACIKPRSSVWQKIQPGDVLYVREQFTYVGGGDPGILLYGATWRLDADLAGCDPIPPETKSPKFTPGIHMPRAISRLTLEVTAIKVERLQAITEADALAEGAEEDSADGQPVFYFSGGWELGVQQHGKTAVDAFRWLWEALHGKSAWDSNPDVVAISFKVHQQNVDAFLSQREAA